MAALNAAGEVLVDMLMMRIFMNLHSDSRRHTGSAEGASEAGHSLVEGLPF